jgi:hypothetical protein
MKSNFELINPLNRKKHVSLWIQEKKKEDLEKTIKEKCINEKKEKDKRIL